MHVTDLRAESRRTVPASREHVPSPSSLTLPHGKSQTPAASQAGMNVVPTCCLVTTVLPRELATSPPFAIADSILCNLSLPALAAAF